MSSSFTPRLVTGLVSVASTVAIVAACGTDSGSEFSGSSGDGGSSGIALPDGGFGSSGGGPADANLYANDPPPKWCGPGSDPAPPPPGGTEQCPDDKNLPGCGCTNLGAKVQEVIATLKQLGISQLPVVDKGKLKGIISEVDLLRHMVSGPKTASSSIAPLIESDYATVTPDTKIELLQGVRACGDRHGR